MEGGKANRRKGKPGQINKKSTRKGSKKKKNKNTKRNYDSKKTTKKGKKPTRRKHTKIELKRKSDRQTSIGCDAFTTIDTMKDYKYVRNQVQKAKRVQSTISQLERKTAKASTVFQNATAFFKKCPEGSNIYDELR